MIKGEKINNIHRKPRILIAPLDWGLGHATRCIPIIKELKNQNCELFLAADGDTFVLLKKEFPSLVVLRVSGYKINYSRDKRWLILNLFFQLPKLIMAILTEHSRLKKITKKHNLDVIISDNRFGMYNADIISIYITHQISIKSGNYFTDKIARIIHNHFKKKYNVCWVPDFKENGLAGELSHPANLQSNVTYIGPLSRFEKLPGITKLYDVLISISGPEPQRTIFENMILYQLKNFRKKVLIVRGLPAESKKLQPPNSFVEIVNHLTAKDMSRAFQQSQIIICRSGYTTIMDLIKIGKEAILIPTPGQTEQEYLAEYLMERKNFFSVKQEKFLLEEVIIRAASFPFIKREDTMYEYKKIITEFVVSLKSGNLATQ